MQDDLFSPVGLSLSAKAQEQLVLSRADCQTIFLKENLQLLAEQLEISQAEAMVLQAKLWPNPSLTIDQVNLWATQGQLDAFDTEGLPPFKSGNTFGTKQQIGVSLEQLIRTAGKRKKRIALEDITLEQSKEYFQDILRSLKVEFRNQLTELQYLLFSKTMYEEELVSLKQLTTAYQRQVELGHISNSEYIRLKALELEMAKKRMLLNLKLTQFKKN
ncbi:TolC family protein [Bizionia myxarmorum]|uniref:TolC family protein n=1 Tax=Bizionia myxarmorum TaxID=291186 RepID=A0A5D0QYU8_9FLAO|nr:TolC family protein [Bizionia myxarmorum]TYB74029.1 TolC family protein [Bizionia myxarmorum]